MLRFVWWVYVTPSVILAVFSFWLWSGLDISKHILSLSLVVMILQSEDEERSHSVCGLKLPSSVRTDSVNLP